MKAARIRELGTIYAEMRKRKDQNVWHGVPLVFSWMSLDIRDDIGQRDRWECVLSGFIREGDGRRAMSSMLWP
ncbi:hypothetical protein ALC56_10986 [Trachymyrmex septentrionalis]|uniref:Uncharacterized protein n=1 Tax=Trachymyrmex septentrionalis TaxID=34720 RepID=A0A195F337_9HYME|nr:hypothetical protein ALC56_10986 [Trachymyrmex septentrionalis]